MLDELVHHCLRELSFDGDFGCDVSRLRDFITGFYASDNSLRLQKLDDAFYAFVWSIIIQQPGVKVGLLPNNTQTEVYIAPNESTERHGTSGDALAGEGVELIEIPDAPVRSLDDLRTEHREGLRVAVSPDMISLALIGSHIRPAKLTPPVYTALQLIARGRDAGLSTVDLSKKTGYDAKTCHYLVGKLVELNLIEKRKKSGVGSHFCIHKYFFDRSPIWQTVLAEEAEAEAVDALKAELEDEELEPDAVESTAPVIFDPIDLRHLSSLPLLRSRIVKLLLASPHHMHTTHNLMNRIGFQPTPGKTDRRFFATRLRELITQGIIEKVQVPHPKKKGTYIVCIRLLSAGEKKEDKEDPIPQFSAFTSGIGEDQDVQRLQSHVTIHKQIVDLIVASGTEGTTITEISNALCKFDRRIVELLLTRLEKYPPPPHLADLAIAQLQETHGRERRFRYFTMASFHDVAKREGLSSHYLENDLSLAGHFMAPRDTQFYTDKAEHDTFVDNYYLASTKVPGSASAANATPRKPPKEKTYKNPILADGSVKKGRPRKYARGDGLDGDVLSGKGKKRKSQANDPAEQPAPQEATPHPVAAALLSPGDGLAVTSTQEILEEPPETPFAGVVMRKRQSPRKNPRNFRFRGQALAPGDLPGSVETAKSVPAVSSSLVSGSSPMAQDVVMEDRTTATPNTPLRVRRSQRKQKPDSVASKQPSSSVTPGRNQSDPIQLPDIFSLPSGTALLTLPHPPAESGAQKPTEIPIDPVLLNYDQQSLSTVKNARKRPNEEPPTTELPLKRAKTAGLDGERGKGNISQVRREKEFLQVIGDLGGIVNVNSREFLEGHASLVDRLNKAGEPSSTRTGSRVDKRTVDATLSTLESQGRVRLLTTSVTAPTGGSRRVRLAYLSEIAAENLTTFLSDMGRSMSSSATAPIKTLDVPLEVGGIGATLATPNPLPTVDSGLVLTRSAEHANQLFQCEEQTIRDSLLAEKDIVAQLYGYVTGKVARARILHLWTLSFLESQEAVSQVVSWDQRVVHISLYYQQLPVAVYCSLVACLEHSKELGDFLQTPEGPHTPLSKLPEPIQRYLQADKSRSQTRLLELLDVLRSIGVVDALSPSSAEHGVIRVSTPGPHPRSYDIAAKDDWATFSTSQHWRFCTTTPIHFWVLKETPTKLWKYAPTSSSLEAETYWRELQFACTDYSGALRFLPSLPQVANEQTSTPKNVGKLLRRPRAWSSSYTLSWYQTQYLLRYVDHSTRRTPLQDEKDGPALVSKLAWVLSAPPDAIKQFFEQELMKMSQEEEKRHQRSRLLSEKRGEKKVSLAQKAAEARQQREKTWEEMVANAHPAPLKGSASIRVRRVRTRYLQSSGADHDKWEAEITQAIEEANISARQVIAAFKPVSADERSDLSTAPPPFVNQSILDVPVETLISQQGPPPTPRASQKKGLDNTQAPDPRRRHRFQWNKDYDELARDASVIIKARCRNGVRLDWAALEQVFPSVPRNSVRQRVNSLKDQAGADVYMRRLEDKWYELWVAHCGTHVLPDSDPESPSNFDLIAHIKFLRSHIDKNAIRVGFVETGQSFSINLPKSVIEFESSWETAEKEPTSTTWDFMWTIPAEEAREKQFLHQALVTNTNDVPMPRTYPTETVHIADATLKMALGTPGEAYDPESASALLKSVGEGPVRVATLDLLERGVLSKVVRDPAKPKPGKTLKISDINQNALGGPLPGSLFHDASAYDESLISQDEELSWRECSLLATDGDMAALVELVSQNMIDLRVDTSGVQFVNNGIDWNSKKIDDDDIETTISIRYLGEPPVLESPADVSNMQDHLPTASGAGHGRTAEGHKAACRKTSQLVDCVTCLEESFGQLISGLNERDRALTHRIWEYLCEASSRGLTKSQLLENFDNEDALVVPGLVLHLTDAVVPIATWAGYSDIVLVSNKYLGPWTAAVSRAEGEIVRILPRRWLDINGRLLTTVWSAALRAIIGVVISRPGVTQAELRWRLRSVYDRQEVHEALQHLLEGQYIDKSVQSRHSRWEDIGPPDNGEEKTTSWIVGESNHWYQV